MDEKEAGKECRFCLQGNKSPVPLGSDASVETSNEEPIEQPTAKPVGLMTFISPCQCKGTSSYVHRKCLAKWMTQEGKERKNGKCAVCKTKFIIDEDLEKAMQYVQRKRESDPEYIKEKARRERRYNNLERVDITTITTVNLFHLFFPWIIFGVVFFLTGGRFYVSLSFGSFNTITTIPSPAKPIVNPEDESNRFEEPPLWTDNCIGVSAAPSALCRKSNGRSVGRPGNPHTFASLVCYMFPFPGCYGGGNSISSSTQQ